MRRSMTLPLLALAACACAVADSSVPSTGVAPAHAAAGRFAPACGPETDLPLAMCFEPGATAEEMAEQEARFYQMIAGSGLRYFAGSRWPGTNFQAVTLTYSFPPDGLPLAGFASGNNVLHEVLDDQFAAFGGRDAWKALFAQVFARWSQVTGNVYVEVPDDGVSWPENDGPATGGAGRGDLRIVMGGLSGSTLAFNFFPTNGDMCLDNDRNWASGAGGNFRFFRNVVSHEHGHGQGLSHSCPQNSSKLMEPGLNTNFDGPQLDDFRGAQSLYGDRFENFLVSLESLGFTQDVNFGVIEVSLHSSGDTDLYSFQAVPPATLNVFVNADGFTYNNGPQNGDGSCQAGSPVTARERQNLAFDIFAPSNAIVLTKDEVPAGQNESVTGFELTEEGTYRIRVRSSGGSDVQMYSMTVRYSSMAVFADMNGDGFVSSTDVAILLGAWGPCPAPPLECSGDLNMDGMINATDLSLMLGAWGG